MKTQRGLTKSEVEEILEPMGLNLNEPDDETFDRNGSVKSWGHDGGTVYVLYDHQDEEYSITDTDA